MFTIHKVLQCLVRCSEGKQTTHRMRNVCSLESSVELVPVNIGCDSTKGL